jgi:cell division transport system permease protein
MNTWIAAHLQAFERAWRRLLAQPTGTLLSVLVIGIAIAMPLGLFTLFANVSAAASRVNTDPNINVYFALGASEAEARAAEKRARSLANVATVRFISREAALAEMKQLANLAELLAGLESNPLPHALTLRPATTEVDALATLRTELAALPKVDKVVMDFEWAQKLKRFATFAERLVILLGAILGVAVIFVTGNTIRLQILTQRDEIEVSRLIGATRRFIRRPFLYFGALQGGLAGIFAVLVTLGFTTWAAGEVAALTASYGGEFALHAPSPLQGLAVVLLAAALGWLGALISVRMHLSRIERGQ